MEEKDFPEYGRQCELITPWRGGAEIDVYEDEIEFD